MRVLFKVVDRLLEQVKHDLTRTHEFAAERVGFFVCRVASLAPEGVVVLAHGYRPVEDAHYIDDPTVGARFSRTDARESAKFVPDFWNVRPEMPHGALVASKDSLWGLCWYPGMSAPIEIGEFVVVGSPMVFVRNQS